MDNLAFLAVLVTVMLLLLARRGAHVVDRWEAADRRTFESAQATYREEYRVWQEYCDDRCGIDEIDRLSGTEFERRLAAMFVDSGHDVTRTPGSQDYGADLIIVRDGVRTVVQAKRWQGSVGVAAVQEVLAAKAYYNAVRALVVTNSHFTRQAQELARQARVQLWGRTMLMDHLRRTVVDLPPPPVPPSAPSPRFVAPQGEWDRMWWKVRIGLREGNPPATERVAPRVSPHRRRRSIHEDSGPSHPPPPTSSPGWYSDPWSPGRERRWDGAKWTRQTR